VKLPVGLLLLACAALIAGASGSVRAQESIPAAGGPPAVAPGTLYQVSFKTARPITGMIIAEYSTLEVLCSWTFTGGASSSGTYTIGDGAAKKFLLSIRDSGDGGQFISVSSRFAHMLRFKVTFADRSSQELVPDFPIVLFNCTLEDMSTCAPGGSLMSPYQDCSRVFTGYVELVVTHSNGTWKDFEQNVLQPLKTAADWSADDVYTFVFRKLDKGYYAEVRVTTASCTAAVMQRLQGSPDVLSVKGRQLIVNYKTAVQLPPVFPANPAPPAASAPAVPDFDE
jgi:hypothetical protein